MKKFLDALRPGRGLPPMVMTTLIFVAGVAAIGYLVDTGAINLDEPVAFTLDVQQPEAASAGTPIRLVVRPRLVNNQEEDVALTAPDPCKIFRWILLDPGNDFVQSKPREEQCAQVVVTNWLEAGYQIEDEFPIELDPRRVRAGGNYRLLVRYWGYETRVPVSIE